MTDPSIRRQDFGRQSDPGQLLDLQQDLLTFFSLGHDPADGSHPAQIVSDLDGYTARAGLGVNPFPTTLGATTFQLVHASGPLITSGYFARADVGASRAGIYEVRSGFGGDRIWCAYAVLKKVSDGDV